MSAKNKRTRSETIHVAKKSLAHAATRAAVKRKLAAFRDIADKVKSPVFQKAWAKVRAEGDSWMFADSDLEPPVEDLDKWTHLAQLAEKHPTDMTLPEIEEEAVAWAERQDAIAVHHRKARSPSLAEPPPAAPTNLNALERNARGTRGVVAATLAAKGKR